MGGDFTKILSDCMRMIKDHAPHLSDKQAGLMALAAADAKCFKAMGRSGKPFGSRDKYLRGMSREACDRYQRYCVEFGYPSASKPGAPVTVGEAREMLFGMPARPSA